MVPACKVSSEASATRLKWFKEGVTSSHWVTRPKKKNLNPRYPRKIPYVKSVYVEIDLKDKSLV